MHFFFHFCISCTFSTLVKNNLNSLMVQMVKTLPAMQETWVPSLGGEDPLEEGLATRSSTLGWRSPWREEPGTTVHGVAKSRTRQ